MHHITVVGAGLAGCEAAWAAARAGVDVTLLEMKPARRSPAHRSADMAELVCSNSLKAARVDSAAGLLKAEMRRLGSLTLAVADTCAVAAGGALAVDRDAFAQGVTRRVEAHPRIHVQRRECEAIPAGITVVATGPLTDGALALEIDALCGGRLSFFDAAAPIVEAESVDMGAAFWASRYEDGGEGQGDYLNCPLNKAEYEMFHAALVAAPTAPLHGFDTERRVYEGCMPIEVLAGRGLDAIRFGPMKPVGLRDPRTGHRPWAALQLRRENAAGSLLNLVGFQTNLTFPAQRAVFGMIPALREAVYARHGVMHRNSFLPGATLDATYRFRGADTLFFAGQITGVEGYMESAASGILAGANAARLAAGESPLTLPETTMMGALAGYVAAAHKDFQPMGAAMGLLPPIEPPVRDRRTRYAALAERALGG